MSCISVFEKEISRICGFHDTMSWVIVTGPGGDFIPRHRSSLTASKWKIPPPPGHHKIYQCRRRDVDGLWIFSHPVIRHARATPLSHATFAVYGRRRYYRQVFAPVAGLQGYGVMPIPEGSPWSADLQHLGAKVLCPSSLAASPGAWCHPSRTGSASGVQ